MPWVQRETFHWVDYVVFTLVLVISLFIGAITLCCGKKQKTKSEFVMGGKSLSVIPTSLSMVMSFMSAIMILGAPAEMYGFGTMYWMVVWSLPLAFGFIALFLVPLLYPLNKISCYEYLELRFNSKSVKVISSAMMITSQLIYIGIASFSPSTALEAATGFPPWASIILVGVIATIYSVVGGVKGTIWSSVFQSVVMFGGVIAITIAGSIKVGGLARVFEVNREWDRVEFFNFDPNPTTRNTFWTLVIGHAINYMCLYGPSQTCAQRYCALPTRSKGQQSILWNIPFAFILITVCCLNGLIMFTYFADLGCDPVSDGRLNNPNQVLPYFVMQTMAWPGFPGLFVSTLFAGSLSTVAACLNAIAACTWEDFMKWKWNHLSDAKQTVILKILVFVYGVLGIIMAFLTSFMGGHVLQAANSFVVGGLAPLLGLFLLGGCFPWANWIGAVVGAIAGLIMPMWVSTGAYVLNIPAETYDMPIANCTGYIPGPTEEPYERSGLELFYSMSYLWFPALGVGSTLVVGLLVSLITGPTKANTVPKKYLIPFFDRLFCCFPEKWLVKCRCGYSDDEEEEEIIDTKSGGGTRTSYVECADYSSMDNGSSEVKMREKPSDMETSAPPGYCDVNVSTVTIGQINPAFAKEHGTQMDHLGRLSTTF